VSVATRYLDLNRHIPPHICVCRNQVSIDDRSDQITKDNTDIEIDDRSDQITKDNTDIEIDDRSDQITKDKRSSISISVLSLMM
jgi:hypothetical protein